MAKKSVSYKPQQRRRTKETLESPEIVPFSPDTAEHSIEDTIAALADSFEVEAASTGQTCSTFLGSLTSSLYAADKVFLDGSVELSKDDVYAILPELVTAAREAAIKLREQGFDRIHSHEIIPRKDFAVLFSKTMNESSHALELLNNLSDSNVDPTGILDTLSDMGGLQQTAYTRLLRVYGLSQRMARIIRTETGVDIYDQYRDGALSRLEQEMELNPSSVRRETSKQLRFLFSDQVDDMLIHYGYLPEKPPLDSERESADNNLPTQELDFTVLPAGTNLREFAEEILSRLNNREKAHIDLDRISVLAAIREHIGKERCYYAHGKKTGNHMSDETSETLVDEDYIVLIIQTMNENGVTIGEDALAISPIAQKHAAYLTRQDVSAGSWREILSLPKQDARYFGARDLRFTGSAGRTPYTMMEEKIKALLDCHADDFHEKLRMRSDGSYRLENQAREMGRAIAPRTFTVS